MQTEGLKAIGITNQRETTVCSQLIIFVSPNEKRKKRKFYWLLAYHLPLILSSIYGAKHVKTNTF
jgi:hypothetical protein